MKKNLLVDGEYLCVPIHSRSGEKRIEVFLLDPEGADRERKLFEWMVPMGEGQGEYSCDFYARIPVGEWRGRMILVEGEMTASFAGALRCADEAGNEERQGIRPVIHFTADTGWTNDPNGLIYDGGLYHLYFQYNPFGLWWNNMSWGHAVSPDLLHWTQMDTAMFPDGDGAVYSGCAVRNDGTISELPEGALLFFYTAAGGMNGWSRGKPFTQKMAFSLDGGKTLKKKETPCVPAIYEDSRDPKIFRHEATGAWIMVLWLRENDFGILRSVDLKKWELTHEFTLEDGWECPDLFELSDGEGRKYWFFWSADGYYYEGEFDGWHFKTDGRKRRAYLTKLSYAAQTCHGAEGRVVSIPWLRLENAGQPYTGSYGIPVEFSCRNAEEGRILLQNPVRELMEQAKSVTEQLPPDETHRIRCRQEGKRKAVIIRVRLKKGAESVLSWQMGESLVEYAPGTGRFAVDGQVCSVKAGTRDILFVVDDRIMEVFFDGGARMGAFALQGSDLALDLSVEAAEEYEIWEIE